MGNIDTRVLTRKKNVWEKIKKTIYLVYPALILIRFFFVQTVLHESDSVVEVRCWIGEFSFNPTRTKVLKVLSWFGHLQVNYNWANSISWWRLCDVIKRLLFPRSKIYFEPETSSRLSASLVAIRVHEGSEVTEVPGLVFLCHPLLA